MLKSDPKKVRGQHTTCRQRRGVGRGSIRIHQPDVQKMGRDVLQIPPDETNCGLATC